MRRPTGWRPFACGLLLAVWLASNAACLALFETRVRIASHTEELYYPSGRFLREATLGFREMAADYLWFQTIQYYGAYRKGEHDLRYFLGLIESTTQLDPRFMEAYYFGALVMCFDMGDIALAVDTLKRGILANPQRWALPFQVGFINYLMTRDYDRAALWFRVAAEAPDATDFARRFAAFASKRSGDIEGSLALWQHLYETSDNPRMKNLASRMLQDCQDLLRQQAGGREAGGRKP